MDKREGSRREDDARWKEIKSQLSDLVLFQFKTQVILDSLEKNLGRLSTDVERVKEFVLGGAYTGEHSLKTKLHELEALVKKHNELLNGPDVLHPQEGLVWRQANQESGQTTRTVRRGQTVMLLGSALLFLGSVTVGIVSHLEGFKSLFKADNRPYVEQIRADVKISSKNPKTRARIEKTIEEYTP